MSLFVINRLKYPSLRNLSKKKYSTAVEKEIVEDKSKKPRKSKEGNEWEKAVVLNLNKEYQKRENRERIQAKTRAHLAANVNYITNNNIKHVFGLAANDANLMKTNPYIINSKENFAVILKFAASLLSQNYNSRSPGEWDTILLQILHFLSRVDPRNNVTAIGYLTVLKELENFLTKNVPRPTENIMNLMFNCRTKAAGLSSMFDLSHKQLLFDIEEIQQFNQKPKTYISSAGKDTYDPNLLLVKSLEKPSFSPDFDSPFVINQRSRIDYAHSFENQLNSEMGGFMRVENFTRIDKTSKPMEDYITEWKWKEKIASEFKKKAGYVQDSFLKQCLANIDHNKCADVILNVIHAALSEGQSHIPVHQFRNGFAEAVLHHAYNNFLSKINVSPGNITREVFSQFLEYFSDHKLAQIYTIRQWWKICCDSQKVDHTLTLPFNEFKFFDRKKLGSFLIDIVAKECTFTYNSKEGNAFGYGNIFVQSLSNITKEDKQRPVKMIKINSALKKMIKEIEFNHILFPHRLLPLRVPPRPWIDKGKNGPFYSYSTNIVRLLEEYLEIDVCEEFTNRLKSPVAARPVFDALNDLGSTPWIINGEMLDVLMNVFTKCSDKTQEELLSKLSVPLHADTFCVPDFASVFGETATAADISTEEWRNFFQQKSVAVKNKYETNSLWAWLRYRVALARHYRNDVLFFPHNMDFRGRVYPISPHLNHMGDDINRCVLKFAKGKRLGKRGLYWLKLHVINITGLMKKKSIKERINYFEEHIDDILDSANDPLNGKQWWLDSDDPWQTLAACKELRDALKFENPEDFISHLPIHQDGSCNGLQHYAALGRDLKGALEVNLCPADKPADIYSTVAASVEKKRIEDENDETSVAHEIAKALRAALPEAVPRKVVKQTVMTTVYGVTPFGAVLQIKKQLKSLDIDSEKILDFSQYLTNLTFKSLHEAFKVSMEIKDWFQSIARVCYKQLKPVEWTTPLGMPVMQPYLKVESKLNKTVFLPVKHKQINSFPPNYVHSLDSTHMMLTALHCHKQGITYAAIHDCYWTHASTVDIMNKICREQFIEMYNQPLIQKLSEEMLENCLPNSLLQKMSEEDANKIKETLTPSFQFGQLDITQVKDSVFFFS